MNLSAIKDLRSKTGAGFMDCKQALQESGQNEGKALDWLKKNGLLKAEKRTLREARQGQVASYIHGRGRIGVLVEVNVETDFAAASKDFSDFVHQLCLHIAALNPLFIHSQDIPPERLKKEQDFFMQEVQKTSKPAAVQARIVEGRLKKWFSEVCLMDQIFLPSSQGDSPQTIAAVLTALIARLGENVVIRRFTRFELGEKDTWTAVHTPAPLKEKQ